MAQILVTALIANAPAQLSGWTYFDSLFILTYSNTVRLRDALGNIGEKSASYPVTVGKTPFI